MMALLVHSLWRSLKPNFYSLSTAAKPVHSLNRRCKDFLIARIRTVSYHDMSMPGNVWTDVTRGRGNDNREGSDGQKQNKYSSLGLMFVPAVFSGILKTDSAEEASPEKNLVNHIKRSILLIQDGEVEKAEQLLHITLKMAQDLKHEKGITYVYDTLANLAFEKGEYLKAQRLFVEVLRRLIGNGLPQDDIKVIHISLKIADTFVAVSDFEKAEQGFLFCINLLKEKIAAGVTDEDTSMLYSQALDRFGLFLLHINKPKDAVRSIESAVEVATSVLGDLNNSIGAILLSDMGAIKTAAGDKSGGAVCFEEAMKIANQSQVEASMAVIMVNRGVALQDIGNLKEAKHWCELGRTTAIKEKNKVILKAAERCLERNIEIVNRSQTGNEYSKV